MMSGVKKIKFYFAKLTMPFKKTMLAAVVLKSRHCRRTRHDRNKYREFLLFLVIFFYQRNSISKTFTIQYVFFLLIARVRIPLMLTLTCTRCSITYLHECVLDYTMSMLSQRNGLFQKIRF